MEISLYEEEQITGKVVNDGMKIQNDNKYRKAYQLNIGFYVGNERALIVDYIMFFPLFT